mgnify:FL=1|jgi:hypothetical protein
MTNGDCEAAPGSFARESAGSLADVPDRIVRKGDFSFAGFPKNPLIVLEAIRNSDKTADNVTAGIRVMETTDRS